MTFTLRPYQQEAVNKLLWSQKFPEPDICVLPTGAGKSLVISDMAHRLNQPVLILQPSKEILEQNLDKMKSYVPESEIGVYSASMGRKDFGMFTFATIGSIYKKPQDFSHFRQVIIDECHGVNPKNLDGMFTQFLRGVGNPKVIGFTATPYRQDVMYQRTEYGELLTHTTTKLINRTKGRFWHRIMYNVNNADLVQAGYLVPLTYLDKSIFNHSEIPTNISKSDFNLDRWEEMMANFKDNVLEAVFFGMELAKSVLVFCTSVRQAEWLAGIVPGSAVVSAKTPKKERERVVSGFKSGAIQTVFNVGVFTIGFDHPTLGAIVLLRPTRSIALYYQMVGRGVRTAQGKKTCYVVDMSGTVKSLGRIETIKLVKREKWELESEKGSWHNRILYSFEIKQND